MLSVHHTKESCGGFSTKGDMVQRLETAKFSAAASSSATEGADARRVASGGEGAHELNNPLDAVLRFVSMAQRKAKTGDYSDVDRHLSDAQFGLQRMVEVLAN